MEVISLFSYPYFSYRCLRAIVLQSLLVGLAALVAETVAAAKSKEGEDYDDYFRNHSGVETEVVAGFE